MCVSGLNKLLRVNSLPSGSQMCVNRTIQTRVGIAEFCEMARITGLTGLPVNLESTVQIPDGARERQG